MRNMLIALLLTLAAAFTFGAAVAQDGEPMILPTDPITLVVETGRGERSFTIEVADTDQERSAGLMFRRNMADDHGMLFVFEQTRRVAFWMKNTPMPLDLVFIGDNGRVEAILPGEPFSTAPIAPDAPVRFVLELRAGTAQKAGMSNGDTVRHPEIDRVAGEE